MYVCIGDPRGPRPSRTAYAHIVEMAGNLPPKQQRPLGLGLDHKNTRTDNFSVKTERVLFFQDTNNCCY